MKKLKLIIVAGRGGGDFIALEKARMNSIVDYSVAAFISTDPGSGALSAYQKNYSIPPFVFDDFKNRKDEHFTGITGIFEKTAFDFVLLCGFTFLLPASFTKQFSGRVINSHHALLPAHPGLFKKEKLLQSSDKFLGATIHFVDEGIDTGQIISQCVFPNPGIDALESALRTYRFAQDCMAVELIRNLSGETGGGAASYTHGVLFNPGLSQGVADFFSKQYFSH